MSNSISNKIGKLIELDWREELIELQPEDVKVKINHEYLKESLLKHGFALPFFVWNSDGQYYCIDGHTRKQVLEEMIADGVKVPKKLKALEIVCESKKEAIDILVSVYNQKQNKFNEEVLMQWLETEEVEVQYIESVNIQPTEVIKEPQEKEEKEEELTENWYINVKATCEEEAQDLYERLYNDGYDVKILN